MLPDTTLRRPRVLFAVGLFILTLTLFLSYERIKSSALYVFQPAPNGVDKQRPITDQEAADYKTIFDKLPPMSYGTASRPPLKGMPHHVVADLPPQYVPSLAAGDGLNKRLIIVGDVHGQKKALESLLSKLRFNTAHGDHLILTGDLVNKGPDSAGVVTLAMQLGAHAVRGNHDDRVLLTHASMTAQESSSSSPGGAVDLETTLLDKFQPAKGEENKDIQAVKDEYLAGEAALSKGDKLARETARSLSKEHVEWLSRLPLILRVGPIPQDSDNPTIENLVVVHAGLVPKVSLEDQDPWAVMNMRTLTYPVDELRRDAVKNYLTEKAKRGGERGKLAKIKEVDDAMITAELERIMLSQGLDDRTSDVALPSSGREGVYWYEEWSRLQEKMVKDAKKKMKKGKNVDKKDDEEVGTDEAQEIDLEVEGQQEDEDVVEEEKHEGGHGGKNAREPVTTVVYGHDAKSGLRIPDVYGKGKKGYTFGLDSGCVYGKKLSALVIQVRDGRVVHEIAQVKCDKAVDADS